MSKLMDKSGYYNQDISDIDCSGEIIKQKEFCEVKFTNCSFQAATLNESNFENCLFQNCNLSLVKTRGTRFLNVYFTECKLLGINWGDCNHIFKAGFENCLITESNFFDMSLQTTVFRDSRFDGTCFSNTNLTKAQFINCDLNKCIFHNAILDKTDFSTSYNYFISAEDNNLSGAIFSLPEAAALLQNFNIKLV